ncbi:hypothetical protein J1N35_041409 [Gossypium stocksii]|uniref:Uncharacterized protein n=1 Tax=Gossypium stocksii TaxID=47602 RepID=A0A9D3UFG4_9ROSI|nr:hypothetical protein J1N35_041409 [Gossypium stocksii]
MFPLVTRWNHGLSYVGLLEVLEDIRLLLDQQSKAEMWDVNVLLIMYAMVEIHESDWVLRQFGLRQRILPSLQDLKELHKVWDHRMQSISVRKQFFSADMVAIDDYLAWSKVVSKSYLLSPEERS